MYCNCNLRIQSRSLLYLLTDYYIGLAFAVTLLTTISPATYPRVYFLFHNMSRHTLFTVAITYVSQKRRIVENLVSQVICSMYFFCFCSFSGNRLNCGTNSLNNCSSNITNRGTTYLIKIPKHSSIFWEKN